MEFTVHVFETVTGTVRYFDMPYMGTPEFTRALNDDGHIKITIPLDDASTPSKETLRQLVAGWRYSLAVVLGNFIVAAGPIMTWNFNQSQMTLEVGAGSIWALLSRRLLREPSTPIVSPLSMDPSHDVQLTGSKHDVAAGLVELATSAFGGSYALPLVIPTDTGGASIYNYPIYDLVSPGQRLRDLTQEEDGPDVDFDPFFLTPQSIAYNVRIGDPELRQVGQDLYWDADSSIVDIDVDSDWSTVLTRSFVRGNATERASEVAVQQGGPLPAAGWPELEVVDSTHQSVTVFFTLQSYANENVRYFQLPTETWGMEVDTDASPIAGTYRPGDTARINVHRHPWLAEGEYNHRLLGWSNGQGQNRLRLFLEDTQGSI